MVEGLVVSVGEGEDEAPGVLVGFVDVEGFGEGEAVGVGVTVTVVTGENPLPNSKPLPI